MECVRTRLMRTFEPLNVPSYTHPRSESESVHVFGSTFLAPHSLVSSSSGSRSGTLLGSERSQRTCASGERGTWKTEVKTHVVQIVDQPSQIFALQTWDSILIFVPAEEVDKLVAETRRISVEIAEFLQSVGQGHGDDTTTTRITNKNDGPPSRVRTVLVSSRRPHGSHMIIEDRPDEGCGPSPEPELAGGRHSVIARR